MDPGTRSLLVDCESNLCHVLIAAGRWEEAEAASSRALELDPTHAKARFRRARAHIKLGLPTEAAADLALLRAAEPNNAQILALVREVEALGVEVFCPAEADSADDAPLPLFPAAAAAIGVNVKVKPSSSSSRPPPGNSPPAAAAASSAAALKGPPAAEYDFYELTYNPGEGEALGLVVNSPSPRGGDASSGFGGEGGSLPVVEEVDAERSAVVALGDQVVAVDGAALGTGLGQGHGLMDHLGAAVAAARDLSAPVTLRFRRRRPPGEPGGGGRGRGSGEAHPAGHEVPTPATDGADPAKLDGIIANVAAQASAMLGGLSEAERGGSHPPIHSLTMLSPCPPLSISLFKFILF